MSVSDNLWRQAIEEAMVLWEMCPRADETPKQALHRLIAMEITAALDPVVSDAAAELVAHGRLIERRSRLSGIGMTDKSR